MAYIPGTNFDFGLAVGYSPPQWDAVDFERACFPGSTNLDIRGQTGGTNLNIGCSLDNQPEPPAVFTVLVTATTRRPSCVIFADNKPKADSVIYGPLGTSRILVVQSCISSLLVYGPLGGLSAVASHTAPVGSIMLVNGPLGTGAISALVETPSWEWGIPNQDAYTYQHQMRFERTPFKTAHARQIVERGHGRVVATISIDCTLDELKAMDGFLMRQDKKWYKMSLLIDGAFGVYPVREIDGWSVATQGENLFTLQMTAEVDLS